MTRFRTTTRGLAALFAIITPALFIADAVVASGADDEPAITSRVASLALFKNGIAVVRREVTLPGPGQYRLDDLPEPVHGTFWIESDAVVDTRITRREITVPVGGRAGRDPRRELAGRMVTLHLRPGSSGPTSVTGRVIEMPPDPGPTWNRDYARSMSPAAAWWYAGVPAPGMPMGADRYLVLETDQGREYINNGLISSITVADAALTATVKRPVLILDARADDAAAPITVAITYLTRGMAWALLYAIDLDDPTTLTVRQKAVLRNELGSFEDASIALISGYPSIEFAHVVSPLAASASWATFFQQLNQRVQSAVGMMSNVMSQYAVGGVPSGGAADLGPADPGDGGVDLHEQPIGTRTMDIGDTLAVHVASAASAYERVVEWTIPDTRTALGRFIPEHQRQADPERFDDAPWDAVRFRNPFDFPMTTGPAMVRENGHFRGQRSVTWANPGEPVTARITKALSVRTRHAEHEEPGDREIIYIGGNDFRETTVKGEVLVCNHRHQPVTLVIRRRFSGDLIEADADPANALREEGIASVNRRHELTWTITLAPEQERTLTYRYTVLVDH